MVDILNNIPNAGSIVGSVLNTAADTISAVATAPLWATDLAQNAITGDGAARNNVRQYGFRNSRYNFNYLAFPGDLTNDYHGHYMVININVPTGIFARNTPRGGFNNLSTFLSNEFSTVDRARFAATGGQTFLGTDVALNRAAFSTGRRTRRIAESIALYMPSGLVYNTQNKYEEVSMTALAGKALGVGAKLAGINSRVVDSVGRNIGAVSSLAGYPINPRVEVLYSHTDLRSFRFEVLMAPRNEAESIAIEKIVQTLRFHSAPELDPQTAGFTFIPPAEFDISFYNKGVENTKIPRINTCVLNVIEVDYAPASGTYATFRNGHPVAVRLSLGFTEVEPLHKARIAQGF